MKSLGCSANVDRGKVKSKYLHEMFILTVDVNTIVYLDSMTVIWLGFGNI